ncbi:MAG: glycoside hydrolase family 65 protein [Bradymonadaceae bacterium]|nr:glycoside hydrolase family 65 protein [Lujinxingiaceae bacterium]
MSQHWSLVYEGFDPEDEGLREALCALGNGYFVTRGAACHARADGVHYPGTYFAGGYNRLKTEIAGREVENEDLVNMPNWLSLGFRIEDGAWFDLRTVEILSYRQALEIDQGLLCRDVRFADDQGRITRLSEKRFVHMDDPHVCALELVVTAENWSGSLEICSELDGSVTNGGVARYRALNGKHLEYVESSELDEESVYLKVRTNQSRVEVALAARTRVFRDHERVHPLRELVDEEARIAHRFQVTMHPEASIIIEKMVVLYTSRDHAISEAGLEAREHLGRLGSFGEAFDAHCRAWMHLWHQFDMEMICCLDGQARHPTLILRLHIFHLLQSVSLNTRELDVGVPARGWHGEAYRGHVFWDELFIFPLLNLRMPEITRSLLRYRYRRLDQAREAAADAGFAGAMFPWQSGSNGREETQHLHLNPRSGRWNPDNTHLQRHVSADIAYNVWQYHQVTAEQEFMAFYGAEILLEVARFMESLASYNAELDRFEIRGVMGPDEYHDAYPGATALGIDNNAYTNVMAVWVLMRAREALDTLPELRRKELCDKIGLSDSEIARWEQITCKMRICFHGDGIISQFEGYDQLEEFDWAGYRERYGDIHRLDRILEAEGDTANRYKLSKQADVLMLFYLFSQPELRVIFERLGYPFSDEMVVKNVAYYLDRTSHGSTLSGVVHAWVMADSDRAHSWKLFTHALMSDVSDVQGGTTPEGIHLGAMAGTVDIVQRSLTGIQTRDDVLWVSPRLPKEVSKLHQDLRYRGHALAITITHEKLCIDVRPGGAAPIKIGVKGKVYTIGAGESREFRFD